MLYRCGHAVKVDKIRVDELWNPDELRYDCSVAPSRSVDALVAAAKDKKKKKITTTPMTTTVTVTATENHGVRATDMAGSLPLGWIIAWALDGAEVVAEPPQAEGEPPVVMLNSVQWREHLVRQLKGLRKFARTKMAGVRLKKFWGSLANLEEALAALRRCEAEAAKPSASATSRMRTWKAQVRWRGTFERAQRDLECKC